MSNYSIATVYLCFLSCALNGMDGLQKITPLEVKTELKELYYPEEPNFIIMNMVQENNVRTLGEFVTYKSDGVDDHLHIISLFKRDAMGVSDWYAHINHLYQKVGISENKPKLMLDAREAEAKMLSQIGLRYIFETYKPTPPHHHPNKDVIIGLAFIFGAFLMYLYYR